jgi:hypothetical protein
VNFIGLILDLQMLVLMRFSVDIGEMQADFKYGYGVFVRIGDCVKLVYNLFVKLA